MTRSMRSSVAVVQNYQKFHEIGIKGGDSMPVAGLNRR